MSLHAIEEITVPQALKKFEGYEWYDNHRYDIIQSCHRKGFWHLVGPQGTPLELAVGDAAIFGGVWHAGLAQYYSRNTYRLPYETRLAAAARGFEREWRMRFANSDLPTKYQLRRGLQQQVMYFDHFRTEDEFFVVIDSEVGFAILIKPRASERFDPFVFTGRIDRILYRTSRNDIVIAETKTCGGDPAKRAKELRLDRQTRGYNAIARKMMDEPVAGVLVDVVQITATKLTADIFVRDYFPLKDEDGESWRRQTIHITQQWREMLARAKKLSQDKAGNAAVLDVFDQRTKECNTYGLCPYYELCSVGISADTLSKYVPDTWHPLADPLEATTKQDTLKIGEL